MHPLEGVWRSERGYLTLRGDPRGWLWVWVWSQSHQIRWNGIRGQVHYPLRAFGIWAFGTLQCVHEKASRGPKSILVATGRPERLALGLGLEPIPSNQVERCTGTSTLSLARIWYLGVWDTSMHPLEGVQRSKVDTSLLGETPEVDFGFGFGAIPRKSGATVYGDKYPIPCTHSVSGRLGHFHMSIRRSPEVQSGY